MRRLVAWLVVWVWLIGFLAAPSADAAKPTRRPKPAKPPAVAPVKTDLFKAINAKQVMASFVPRDAEIAQISLLNVSNTPLEVGLPSAFAVVPVVALANLQPAATYLSADPESSVPQILGSVIPTTFASTATRTPAKQRPSSVVNGPSSVDSSAATQPSAVQTSPGQTSAGQTSAVTMILQPRQMRQFAVPCVCLQYGNPTPSPNVPYRLVSLDSVSRSPQLRALLNEFSQGRLDQPVVQLAAWHFSNNLSWEQLGSTGFAAGRLGEAQGLATLIETDVSRKRTKDGSQATGQVVSPGSGSQQPTAPPTNSGN